jgi:DNA-binding NarL/FixJ family response regulator
MRALIANDSELFVERLVAALAKMDGMENVGRASPAAEAREVIGRLKPDVVILDLSMPGGSGMSVLKGLKRERFAPVVIVLSAHGEVQCRQKCLENGDSFFLDKATEFERVGEVLRRLVRVEPALAGNRHEGSEQGKHGSANPRSTPGGERTPSRAEGTRAVDEPELQATRSSKGEPNSSICPSRLMEAHSPCAERWGRAIEELTDSFLELDEQEHSEPGRDPFAAPAK